MNEPKANPPVRPANMPTSTAAPDRRVEELIRLIGQVFSNAALYGLTHSVTARTLEQSFKLLQELLGAQGKLTINVSPDQLTVNGQALSLKNPLLAGFGKRMQEVELTGLVFERGVTGDEFVDFVKLVAETKPGATGPNSLAARLALKAWKGIQARRVTFQQVSEQEVVVDRAAVSGAGGNEAIALDQVIGLLKGALPADDPQVVKNLSALAEDIDKLSSLIVTMARQGLTKEPEQARMLLAESLAASLRRVYEGLSQDPASRTQKGKKLLSGKLAELEQKIMVKLKELTGGEDAAVSQQLNDTVEEMQDELQIDTLAADYSRKQKAIAGSQKKLLRFLNAKNAGDTDDVDPELKRKLIESGLEPADWDDLMLLRRKGRKGGGVGRVFSEAEVEQMLSGVLAELSKAAEVIKQKPQTGPEQSGFNKALAKVGRGVDQIIAQTDQKIEALAEAARRIAMGEQLLPESAVVKEKQALSQEQLFKTLGEIVQELRQPLSVINCSLEMISRATLGEVSEAQQNLLTLSAESGKRLDRLITKLSKVSGMPRALQPDKQVLDDLYKP